MIEFIDAEIEKIQTKGVTQEQLDSARELHGATLPDGQMVADIDDEIRAAQEIGVRFHPTRGSMSLGESQGGLPVADDARGAYVRGLFSEMNGEPEAALSASVMERLEQARRIIRLDAPPQSGADQTSE